MKYIYITFLFLFSISFSACSNQPKINTGYKRVAFPQWYVKPPHNTLKNMYGVAQGDTMEIAKNRALSNAVSKLYIEVQSDYQSTTTLDSTVGIKYEVVDTIKVKVKNIAVQNYNVIEQKEMGFENYVILISIDNNKIKEYYLNRLEELYENDLRLRIQKKDLKNIAEYKTYVKELEENISYLSILKYLSNGNFDSSYYMKHLKNSKVHLNNMVENNTIHVKGFVTNKSFNNRIAEIVSKNNGLVLNKTNYKYLIVFEETKCVEEFSFGMYITKCFFSIKIIDKNNNIINTKTMSYKGLSGSNFENSKNNLYKLLFKSKELQQYLTF